MSRKLNVIFLCGPRYGGKSSLLRLMACKICPEPPHYVRLVPVDTNGPRLTLLGDLREAGLCSWRRVNYDAAHIFELLPECLQQAAESGRSRTVIIEADADPSLRYAYPYDSRIFVMPAPRTAAEVFRTPAEAATALHEVMDDTAAFASEIFGLFDPDSDEDGTATYQQVSHHGVLAEERVEITPVQMRRFMNSPLGAEIASRIQLQPAYHSLIESDVIVVNMAVGGRTRIVDACVKQIQTLLLRLSEGRMSAPRLFNCDPLDHTDPLQERLLQRLSEMSH